jgi:hypothetical protein
MLLERAIRGAGEVQGVPGLWTRMSSFLSRRSDPRNLVKKFTKAHRRALEEYAALKISLEELRRRLAGVVEFDFQNHERRLDSHYGTPVPGVRIELKHIQAATEKQAEGIYPQSSLRTGQRCCC